MAQIGPKTIHGKRAAGAHRWRPSPFGPNGEPRRPGRRTARFLCAEAPRLPLADCTAPTPVPAAKTPPDRRIGSRRQEEGGGIGARTRPVRSGARNRIAAIAIGIAPKPREPAPLQTYPIRIPI